MVKTRPMEKDAIERLERESPESTGIKYLKVGRGKRIPIMDEKTYDECAMFRTPVNWKRYLNQSYKLGSGYDPYSLMPSHVNDLYPTGIDELDWIPEEYIPLPREYKDLLDWMTFKDDVLTVFNTFKKVKLLLMVIYKIILSAVIAVKRILGRLAQIIQFILLNRRVIK